MKKVATLVLVTLALSSTLAQSGTPISAEDILKVATAAVLDLSDVGRQVAVGVRRLFDNAETNHRRYGDPTYVTPSMVEVRIVDTATGAADRVGSGLMNVRSAAFTPDASQAVPPGFRQDLDSTPVQVVGVGLERGRRGQRGVRPAVSQRDVGRGRDLQERRCRPSLDAGWPRTAVPER